MAEMCDQISKISNNIEDELGNCFWKIAGLDTFEINVQNSQIFQKKYFVSIRYLDRFQKLKDVTDF